MGFRNYYLTSVIFFVFIDSFKHLSTVIDDIIPFGFRKTKFPRYDHDDKFSKIFQLIVLGLNGVKI
jgi:hypothetical protein